MGVLSTDDTPIQRLLLHPCVSHELNPVHPLHDLPLVTLSDYRSSFGHPRQPINHYLISLAEHMPTNASLQHPVLGDSRCSTASSMLPMHPARGRRRSAESEYISYGTRTADISLVAPV
jgi:hypothetical protein